MSAASTAAYAETVRSTQGSSVKAVWVEELRQKARGLFESKGFPDRHWESWRYLSLGKLLETPFHKPSALPASAESGHPGLNDYPNRLVFVNGLPEPRLSSLLPGVLEVSSLRAALAAQPGLQSFLGQNIETEENPFVLINTFSFEDGALIRIPKGKKAAEPLHLFFLTMPEAGPVASASRILVIAEEDSEASIACHFYGNDRKPGAFENIAAELYLARSARVNWVSLQTQNAAEGTLFLNARAYLKADASLDMVTFSRGREVTRNEVRVDLEGPRAVCHLNGLAVLSGASRVYSEITANHKSEGTISRQFYKNLLDGSSQAEFNSLAYVFPGAQKSDSNQLNKNLLLSDDARVYSRPKLKIYADDVQASHGSANGQSDTQELFYLQSRGLDRKTARFVLAYGFAEEILNQIPLRNIREQLESEVHSALESMIRE